MIEMTLSEIQSTVDKLNHDLYIRGIDEKHCSGDYYRLMIQRYEYVRDNVKVEEGV